MLLILIVIVLDCNRDMFPGLPFTGDLTATVPNPLGVGVSVSYTCSAANLELNGAVNNECDNQGAYLNPVPPTCEQSKS